MIHRIILFSIITLDILILLFQASSISISNHEVDLLHGHFSFVQYIENLSLALFGRNDIALRLPMIVFHVFSILLLYIISKQYLKEPRNQLWLISVFILLPGVISSALLVDSAGFVIFGLLLFIYIHENFSIKNTYPLLFIYSLIDATFIYLFLSLIFYALHKKDKYYLFFNVVLLGISLYFYGVHINGSPKGHLLDVIGLYSAIFTPIIFIYLFYVLYRRFLSRDINIVWFISVTPLLLSLLLSIRQVIYIEDFAPYFIMALPLAAQTFNSSYKVRLKIFRTKYRAIFVLSITFLLVNFFVVLFNRELYLFIDNPKKHFARKMHIAKELSQKLKDEGIYCVNTREKMARRLDFYGVTHCKENILKEQALDYSGNEKIVTISYKYRTIYKASVTNVNIK